jgi:hypothetical protein
MTPLRRFEATLWLPRWLSGRSWQGLHRTGASHVDWAFVEQSGLLGHWDACEEWDIDHDPPMKFINYARRKAQLRIWADLRLEFAQYGRGFMRMAPRDGSLEVLSLDMLAGSDEPATTPARRIGEGLVKALVMRLPRPARELLILYFWERWTLYQIGKMEAVTEASIGQRIKTVLNVLREQLGVEPGPRRKLNTDRWGMARRGRRRWTPAELRAEPPAQQGPKPGRKP